MSTNYQQAREALGARLRELRTETGLNGKDFAGRLGRQRSKVSRLENGKQTAYRANIDHANGCATCAVDSGQCVTAEELWSAYRATTP